MLSKRIIAFIIDLLIYNNISIIFFSIIYFILKSFGVEIDFIAVSFITIFVFFIRDIFSTNSLGKKIMKIKVLTSNNNNIYTILTIRNVLVYYFWWIDIIYIVINHSDRGLIDKITNTIVVNNDNDTKVEIRFIDVLKSFFIATISAYLLYIPYFLLIYN